MKKEHQEVRATEEGALSPERAEPRLEINDRH